jgi:nucleotide-binding universal stress UspA family protein
MSHELTHPTILAAVDFSDLTDVVIDDAIRRAARDGATLHVAHIAPPEAMLDTAYPRRAPAFQSQEHALLTRVGERLALASSKPAGQPVAHVRSGPIAGEIVELAAELDADLVIVGTHGRSGISRRVLGSVAERVARTATCPVLVVREKAHSTPEIERPCPLCVIARRESNGRELWCEQHRHPLGRRHTYHFVPRNVAARENAPLVVQSSAASEPLRH